MNWTIKPSGTTGSGRKYQLKHATDGRKPFLRDYRPLKLREFCDTAVDALEGQHTTGERWSSESFSADRIVIIEHREKEIHMMFTRTDLERLVSDIDTLLEDR